MKDIAMSSGFNVIGKTRAGINLSKLTNGMPYYYGSESWNMWARLSRAYVRQGINKGASFKLFLNNPWKKSIFIEHELPTLINGGAKILK